MATVVPNPYSEALIRTSENFLQLMMQNRQLNQQESQFARRLAQDQSQFDESMAERRQAGALQRLQFFAPFMAGQPVASNPLVAADLGVLYQDEGMGAEQFIDPEGLGSMTFGEQTFEQYRNQRLIDTYENLPDDLKAELDERGLVGAVTGRAVRGTQVQAEGDIVDLQYDRYRQLVENPKFLDQVVRGMAGAPQPVDFTIGDTSYHWDTADEARIAISLMNLGFQRQAMGAQSGQFQGQLMKDMAKDLVDLAKEKNIGISLGTAMSIVQGVMGPPGEDQTRQQVIEELKGSLSEKGQAAMALFINGASLLPPISEILQAHAPETFLYGSMRGLLTAPAEQGGFGMSQEEAAMFAPRLARTLSDSGWSLAHPRGPAGAGQFFGWDLGEVAPPTAQDAGQSAVPSIENIKAQARADAQALANGELTPRDIVEKYSWDPRLVDSIIETAAGM